MRTSPFRSVMQLTGGRRAVAPAVHRATYVVCSFAHFRFALPVKVVERVLRCTRAAGERVASIAYAGEDVPLFNLRVAIGLDDPTVPAAASRQLIVSVSGRLQAIAVDAVHDVVAIDRTAIRTRDAAAVPLALALAPTDSAGVLPLVQGIFTRQEREVVILDILPLMPARAPR